MRSVKDVYKRQSQAFEYSRSFRTALLSSKKNFSTSSSFWIRKGTVFLNDQCFTQRNHKQNAQNTAD